LNLGEIAPVWDGHLAVGLGRISDKKLKPYPETIVSKSELSFANPIFYIDYDLITPKNRCLDAYAKNSSEYFVFTLLTKTKLTCRDQSVALSLREK
jgi:hypothetical protein